MFEQTFFPEFNTRLVKGDDEPVYLPADHDSPFHRIVFAHGYFASALHEIAHWCIAGEQRRLKEDYGYWYCADGRNADQQAAFEDAELKPQAIEWAFSLAAGSTFQVSTDNLAGEEPNREHFEHRVLSQLHHFMSHGFPVRAEQFIAALRVFYNNPIDAPSSPFALRIAGSHKGIE